MKKRLINLLKKNLIIMLICMFAFQTIIAPPIYGVETEPDTQSVENGFVELKVNSDTGRFVINTKDGNPNKSSDDNKKLLFEEDIPETSFTTFRIDGKDYIYGNNYSFLGFSNSFTTKPEMSGTLNQSVWTVDDVEITQTIELIDDITNINAGNVKISYKVVNNSDQIKEIGSRMLLDTMLGDNDGAALVLGTEEKPVIYETKVQSPDIPKYLRLYDNTDSPNIIAYGITKGWDNIEPDEMVIAHYETLSNSKWDLVTNNRLKFIDEYNEYGRADSAYALYFNPETIEPGAERKYETYYGIGSVTDGLGDAKFDVNFLNDNKLEVKDDGTGYVNEEFDIIVELDNRFDESVNLNDVKLTLVSDIKMQLVSGETSTKTFSSLDKGKTLKASWKVKVNPQDNYSAIKYKVGVTTSMNMYDPIEFESILLAPGIKGEKPTRIYNSLSPTKIFNSGVSNLSVKGDGFEYFVGKTGVHFILRNIDDSSIFATIPYSDINIKDDENMDINFKSDFIKSNDLSLGKYKIYIRGLQNEEIIPQTIEITDDDTFKTRSYGICIVTKEVLLGTDNTADKFSYDLKLIPNEDELKVLKAEYDTNNNEIIEGTTNEFSAFHQILLEIRGDITEQTDGSIHISTNSVATTINNAIKYTGEKVVITENDEKIKISLDGKHKTMDNTLMWSGDSDIIFEKGNEFEQNDYSLDAKSEEDIHDTLSDDNRDELIKDNIEWYYINDMVRDAQENIPIRFVTSEAGMRVIGVGGFFVGVKNAIIKENGVSLGGIISLKFIPTPKSEDGDEGGAGGPLPGLTANINGVLFDTEGYYGIDSDIEFVMPANVVGPVLGFGGDATLSIDTTDRDHKEGSIDTTVRLVKNKFQFGTNITLAFTKENKVVLDDLIIKGALGGANKGIYIQRPMFKLIGFGGGYKDMYGFITDSNTAPPGKIVGIGIISVIDEDITQSEASIEFSLHGIKAEGDMVLMPLQCEIFESVGAEIRWSKPLFIDMWGNINILDIIRGQARIYISEEYFKGNVSASITAPDWFPLINGYKFAGVDLGITSDAIWGSLSAPLDSKLGFKYYWDSHSIRDIDFTVKAFGHSFVGNGLYNKLVYDEKGNPAIVSMGTNVTRMIGSTESFAFDPRIKSNEVYNNSKLFAGLDSVVDTGQNIFKFAQVDSKYHTITVLNEDTVIVNAELDPDKEEIPEMHLYAPAKDGEDLGEEIVLTAYNPDTGKGNYIIDERDGSNSETGSPVKYMSIFIDPCERGEGTYIITSSENITIEALEVENPAHLESISANSQFDLDTKENTCDITWEAKEDENGKVNIYLVDENNTENSAGIVLAENLDSSLGSYSAVIPKGITGDYYVKVELTEGDYGYDVMQTEKTVTIIDPDEPDNINQSDIVISTLGNGMLGADFKGVDTMVSKNINAKYYVQVFDEDGNQVESAGTKVLESNDTGEMTTVFGGNFESLDIGQLSGVSGVEDIDKEVSDVGLETGKSYKVGITTVVEEPVEDGEDEDYTYEHTSDIVYSDLKFLPEPNPADIDIKLSDGFVIGERAGAEIPIINSKNVKLNFTSNQSVTTKLLFDKETWTGPETEVPKYLGKSFTHETTLEDGMYSLTVESTNNQGDTTRKDFSFSVDTEAPLLMIENPANGQVVTGGEITVKGKSDLNAVIKINDEILDIDSDGNFYKALDIGNKMKMAINVSATDDAGNSAKYSAQILNGDIANIESVKIVQDIDTLKSGEEIKLSMEGTDANKKIVALDKSQINWSIIDGNDIAQINEDGLLLVDYIEEDREIAVKGSYSINNDYSIEDAMIIKIEKSEVKKKSENDISSEVKKAMNHILMKEKNFEDLEAKVVYKDYVTYINKGEVKLRIPKGIVPKFTKLLIGALGDEGAKKYIGKEEKKKLASSIYEFQLIDDKGDIIDNFDDAVTISFDIPNEFSGKTENLSIYYYNEEFGRWEYLSSYIKDGKMVADTSHFSKYSLLYDEDEGFADIDDRWSKEYIKHLKSLNIVNGVKKGDEVYYEPTRGITRLELAAMVVRSFKLEATDEKLDDEFKDLSEIPNWGKEYASIICSNQIITGKIKDDGKYFDAMELTTRAEVATIIGRILSQKQEVNQNNINTFDDNKEIPSWANDYVKLINSLDIINGYGDNTFKPNKQITREEFAKILSIVLNKKLK